MGRVLLITVLVVFGGAQAAQADVRSLTILHTNDLHSHYNVDSTTGYGLGGIARMKTLVDRLRGSQPATVLFDGGDWSEGHAYYNLEGGRTALEMMNRLGFDATVVGNHDWLNGPGQLLTLLRAHRPMAKLLAANVETSGVPGFQDEIPPYAVLERGGIRIGVIGIVTYEFIYDHFPLPVRITFPFPVVRRLAEELKTAKNCDVVVVISHNSLVTNRLIAALPKVDVVIHAHDHEKLAVPLQITREAKTAYIVEAGKWGHYLGQLDLDVDRTTNTVRLRNYTLHPINDTLPEDHSIATLVRGYDQELEELYKGLGEAGLFRDRVAQVTTNIDERGGKESLMGNLVTDAYRAATGADIAFEHTRLTSGTFSVGWVRPIDILNAVIQVFNPETLRTWTLRRLRATGASLRRTLQVLYVIQDSIPGGLPSVSGLKVVFEAPVKPDDSGGVITPVEPGNGVRSIEVGGVPLDDRRAYTIVFPLGILQALEFIEQRFGYRMDRLGLEDTGIESWKAVRDYMGRLGTVGVEQIPMGDRFLVLKPDLALYAHDVVCGSRSDSGPERVGGRWPAQVACAVTVRNMGAAASQASAVVMGVDATPGTPVDDPNVEWQSPGSLPALRAESSMHLNLRLTVPDALQGAPYLVVYAKVTPPTGADDYDGNNQARLVFLAPPP